MKYTQIFINNDWHNSISGKTFPTINPNNGSKIIDVQEADKADVDVAVNAARVAMEVNAPWRTMDASERGKLMFKLADLMERDSEYLAVLETMDNGRLITSTLADVNESINTFRYYAGYADKIHGKTIPMDGKCFGYTRREPVGVCGQIIPWNYPILMASWKLSTAFAAGCVSVLKPAEQSPLTALKMAALVKEAGFPPGVLAVLPGYGPTAGAALAEHPNVDKVAFTGSTEVGRLVAAEASRTSGKRVSLELGGKSPLVIMDDANIDYAAGLAQAVVFENMGQCCVAGTRTFVHEKIYDEFVKRSTAMCSARVLGNPLDKKTTHGPQVDKDQLEKIMGLIEAGKKEGAKCEIGGECGVGNGYFVKPTVFSNVTDDMRIAKEEIFGPVQSILRFSTLDEVIRRANDTNYGLGAGIVTQDLDVANRFVQEVQAGTVWVNTYLQSSPHAPFGGYKDSGHGRELGEEGLDEYLETKMVITKLPSKNS